MHSTSLIKHLERNTIYYNILFNNLYNKLNYKVVIT
jgi:hypothetical protein